MASSHNSAARDSVARLQNFVRHSRQRMCSALPNKSFALERCQPVRFLTTTSRTRYNATIQRSRHASGPAHASAALTRPPAHVHATSRPAIVSRHRRGAEETFTAWVHFISTPSSLSQDPDMQAGLLTRAPPSTRPPVPVHASPRPVIVSTPSPRR